MHGGAGAFCAQVGYLSLAIPEVARERSMRADLCFLLLITIAVGGRHIAVAVIATI